MLHNSSEKELRKLLSVKAGSTAFLGDSLICVASFIHSSEFTVDEMTSEKDSLELSRRRQ